MKKLLLFLSVVFYPEIKSQTWVTIPDANFVLCLQNYVPSAMHGDSLNTSSTLVTTTTHSINVANRSIANLFGIQYFTSLTYLDCQNNSLTSLPALPNTLTYLDCYFNHLTSLPSLPNSLAYLQCTTNSLTSLSTLPNSLTYLDCQVNSLTSLPILPNGLQTLMCGNNNIPCFPAFSNSITNFSIDPNPYYCLPNYISAMGTAELALPLCAAGNSNNCPVATGIEQITSNTQVTIFPNPTSNEFFIETNTTEKLTLHLYNVNGKHVFSKSVNNKSIIDVTNLNEGVYTLTIKTVDSVINKKLVILH